MMVVKRKGRVMGGDHRVYTWDEAMELGLDVVKWWDGREGDWCVSDDGYVVQLIWRREYRDKVMSRVDGRELKVVMYRFCVGKVTSRSKEFNVTKAIRAPNTISAYKWNERLVKTPKFRLMVLVYIQMVISRSLDFVILSQLLYGRADWPQYVRKVLRDDFVSQVAMEFMNEYLADKGITADGVLQEYKEVLDKAKRDGKYSDALKVLEKFERWTGLGEKITGDSDLLKAASSRSSLDEKLAKMIEARREPVLRSDGTRVHELARMEVRDENDELITEVEVADE